MLSDHLSKLLCPFSLFSVTFSSSGSLQAWLCKVLPNKYIASAQGLDTERRELALSTPHLFSGESTLISVATHLTAPRSNKFIHSFFFFLKYICQERGAGGGKWKEKSSNSRKKLKSIKWSFSLFCKAIASQHHHRSIRIFSVTSFWKAEFKIRSGKWGGRQGEYLQTKCHDCSQGTL